jgi:hypothetical protein
MSRRRGEAHLPFTCARPRITPATTQHCPSAMSGRYQRRGRIAPTATFFATIRPSASVTSHRSEQRGPCGCGWIPPAERDGGAVLQAKAAAVVADLILVTQIAGDRGARVAMLRNSLGHRARCPTLASRQSPIVGEPSRTAMMAVTVGWLMGAIAWAVKKASPPAIQAAVRRSPAPCAAASTRAHQRPRRG